MENKYSFGECKNCGKRGALKDDKCQECNKKSNYDLPEGWDELFGFKK